MSKKKSSFKFIHVADLHLGRKISVGDKSSKKENSEYFSLIDEDARKTAFEAPLTALENLVKVAIENKDIKEVADALTDILYVTYGAGHAFGINLDKCFEEVQNSNMSKLGNDGKPIYNDKGKVMKGPNYFKPNLSKFVA